jgi:tetratricopeptide (TPR) repeat protein
LLGDLVSFAPEPGQGLQRAQEKHNHLTNALKHIARPQITARLVKRKTFRSPSLRLNSKSQINSKFAGLQTPKAIHRAVAPWGFESLEFVWSLGFGIGSFQRRFAQVFQRHSAFLCAGRVRRGATSMTTTLNPGEESQLLQTIEMFEVITQSQPQDYQSLEILKEAYLKLGREDEVIMTARRIAQAYVHLGQLSSAILEYESILQRRPDDADVLAALGEIESKASSLSSAAAPLELEEPAERVQPTEASINGLAGSKKIVPADIDDGRVMMHKLFVDSRLISQGDFDLCWQTPNLHLPPGRPIDPFVQLLADKGTLQLDKSLKLLSEKARLGFLPLEKYDADLDLARSFPVESCQRWCVLPFDKMSKSVLVATVNPFNRQAAKELEAATQARLIWYLAPPTDIIKWLRRAFR